MSIKTYLQALCLGFTLVYSFSVVYAADTNADTNNSALATSVEGSISRPTQSLSLITELYDEGKSFYRQGLYADAIDTWQRALDNLHHRIERDHPLSEADKYLHIDLHRHIATAAQILGFNDRAKQSLQDALALIKQAESTPDIEAKASQVLGQLGDLALGDNNWQQTGQYLGESVVRALALKQQPAISARALNKLGNALTVAGSYDKALSVYGEGLQLAQDSGELLLINTLRLNLIRLHLKLGPTAQDEHWQLAYELFQQTAADLLQQEHATLTTAGDLIALALLGQKLQQHPGKPVVTPTKKNERSLERLNALTRNLLLQAAAIAENFNDLHYRAYAYGYLGQLDEINKQYPQAIQWTKDAQRLAEQAHAPDSLYLWQWQLGRLYRAQGQIIPAIDAYRQAVATLNPIRSTLMNSNRRTSNYEERIRPIYFGLADLLLTQASQLAAVGPKGNDGDKVRRQLAVQQAEAVYQAELNVLKEARDTVEILKAAELQDYFQDECTVELQAKETSLDVVDPQSAIIYPFILPERLVLLLSMQGQLHQVVVPLAATELEATVRRFRQHLQTRASNAYLGESRQLYDWLIRPLIPYLQAATIDTLVFVPDGVLRTIPFSTLQDRENRQYLIQRYSLAMTPSLSLTDPQPFWREEMAPGEQQMEVLIAGLSDAVQGFSPLPSVTKELRTVQSLMGGDVLENQEYSASNLEKALKSTEYGLLHMATHGVFGGSEEHSFLLTHDSKLNMNQLGELLRVGIFRKQPLELLTLSACQTALGDDRAALGLAGVAVQSGARSATASLWFVDDAATAELITEFYQQLSSRKLSKARALQKAQLRLLEQARYRHPIYWGPFLLIGNWL